MLKIYLDWNIITHLKDDKNRELFTFLLTNKEKFIFPYSKAHIKDLLVSKSGNNKYYEQDLQLLTDICEHHLLEHEQNINNPYPYKCYPKDYLAQNATELELLSSGFSKDSFYKYLMNNKLNPDYFMSILKKEKIEPFVIPLINKTIRNLADLFSVIFEYGPSLFNNKKTPKQIQNYIQVTTDDSQYRKIQGSNSTNIFKELDAAVFPQTNKTFVELIENPIAERSKSNLELFTSLYLTLNLSGFFSDKNRNLQNIYTDSEHAYYASSCDFFVSNDSRLREKTDAIYHQYNIQAKIISSDELTTIMTEELVHSYDIKHMFTHDLPIYGEPIRTEGENNVYKQLPYRFWGIFNYCINLRFPDTNNRTGVFRIVIPPRSYVFYTELERFFELIISIISEEEQKLLFKKEFVSKFLTKNKDIIDTATFTIDCPDYLIQLSADKESHIPLPIMFITEKVNN